MYVYLYLSIYLSICISICLIASAHGFISVSDHACLRVCICLNEHDDDDDDAKCETWTARVSVVLIGHANREAVWMLRKIGRDVVKECVMGK